MKDLVRGAAVVLGVQGLLVGGYLLIERAKQEPDASLPAGPTARPERMERAVPQLDYRRADGSTGQLGAHRGKPLLLHFWATWCPPCTRELPALIELGRIGSPPVLLVALDRDWAAVREFFGGRVPPGVVLSDASDVEERFATHVLPESFFIDVGGTMRWRFRGERDWRDEATRALLQRSVDDDRLINQ